MERRNKFLVGAIVLILLLVMALMIVGFMNREIISASLVVNNLGQNSSYNYTGEKLSALDLLKEHEDVNITSSEYGDFINCVGSVCSNDTHYWMYYINGELAEVGAGGYVVQENDSIRFSYEALDMDLMNMDEF